MAPGSSLSQPRDPALGSECRFWESFLCLGTAIRSPAVFVSTLVLPNLITQTAADEWKLCPQNIAC